MAKRFTDNEKWKDAWFMDLPSKYKLFWLYILDECNHAGIWKVNFRVASFCIGEHLEYSEVKRLLKDRITILNDENWYVNKFVKYQYKCDIQGLNIKNKAHLSAIKILNEYDYFKPLTSPLLGVKDKDKEYLDNNDNIYSEESFLSNWSKCRKQFLKKPTNLKKLEDLERADFNIALKDFTKEEINNAMLGLFRQKNKNISSMYLKPKHFLENVSKYLNAELSKDYELYGKDQNKPIGGL